jgi:hypothetical protein
MTWCSHLSLIIVISNNSHLFIHKTILIVIIVKCNHFDIRDAIYGFRLQTSRQVFRWSARYQKTSQPAKISSLPPLKQKQNSMQHTTARHANNHVPQGTNNISQFAIITSINHCNVIIRLWRGVPPRLRLLVLIRGC